MPGKRHTREQKIRILREAEQVGKTALDVCHEHPISEQTFHRWKREFGMLEVDQANRLSKIWGPPLEEAKGPSCWYQYGSL